MTEVIFIAYEEDGEFFVGVVLGFVHPFGQVVVGLPVRDVIDEDGCD